MQKWSAEAIQFLPRQWREMARIQLEIQMSTAAQQNSIQHQALKIVGPNHLLQVLVELLAESQTLKIAGQSDKF